jgi:hypothetical protein
MLVYGLTILFTEVGSYQLKQTIYLFVFEDLRDVRIQVILTPKGL